MDAARHPSLSDPDERVRDVAALMQTLARLGPTRLIALGGVGLGVLAFFFYLTSRLSTEEMGVLYSDLDPSDSSKIVSKLESLDVPFELSRDGSRVMVPASSAARLRMAMAEDGLPSGGSIGYELFDQTSAFGTTSFTQEINHLRALEGELARSIRTLAPIQSARVHLVMPRREVFSRETQEPSASIVLILRGQISRQQVVGIQSLVAAAIPKMSPSQVSVIDDKGNLLAKGADEADSLGLAVDTAEELRRAREHTLARTIEELLGRSVGPGRVRAEVSVDLDFDRVTTNSETYDPDSQVARSTQTVSETSQSTDSRGNEAVTVANNLPNGQADAANGDRSAESSNREEETVNYEIDKTVKTHIREAGIVRRISAAVLVDGNYLPVADGPATYEPRSAEELEKLTALVKSAIGFDVDRGDKVEVVNMQFARPEIPAELPDAGLLGLTKADYFKMAELGVLGVVALLVVLLVVRPLVMRLFEGVPAAEATPVEDNLLGAPPQSQALPGPSQEGEDPMQSPLQRALAGPAEEGERMIDIAQIDGRLKASSVKQLGEIIERHPDEALGIVRQWMFQES